MKPREIAIAAVVGGLLVASLLGCGVATKSDCRLAAELLCESWNESLSDKPTTAEELKRVRERLYKSCLAEKLVECGRPTR